MKCLIIAAGQGTRIRSIAESKPLASLNGTPLIEHVVRLARAGGASEFVVVTGYQADVLEPFLAGLAERARVPILAVRNPDWHRPNGLSVLAAADHLTGEFGLLMSDHLFDPAILAELREDRPAEAALTLAADYAISNPLIDLDDATKVAAAPDGRIIAIGKTLTDYNAIDTGVFLGSPPLLDAIRASIATGGSGSLSEGVQALAEQGRAFVRDIGQRWWIDVDDEAAMRLAERTLPDSLAA
jgi:1L-myo-inositol 1-phosphate cytidylyltransferase